MIILPIVKQTKDLDKSRFVSFGVDPFDLHKSELERMSRKELIELANTLIQNKKNKI